MKAQMALLLAAVVAAAILPAAARADKVDRRLHEEMPEIKKYLDDKGYKNVGILRFRVQKGHSRAKFDSAPYNGNLPVRIENMLIIHGGPDEAKAIQVIHDAGAVASKATVGDWYGDAKERKKLFTIEYPLAWGKKKVTPDAFLSGLVRVDPKLKTTTFYIACFTKDDEQAKVIKQFTLDTDRDILRDLGFSFALSPKARQSLVVKRGPQDLDRNAIDAVQDGEGGKALAEDKDKGKDEKKDEFIRAADGDDLPKPKKDEPIHQPKKDVMATPSNIAGVEVVVLVDENEHEIRSGEGGSSWQMTCPAPGKKIAFRLRNTTDKRMGVVLKLNGVSTYNQQNMSSDKCLKWVINPGKTATIKGFMVPDKEEYKPDEKVNMTALPFKVVVGAESRDMKSQLGDKAGLIEVDVFAEGEVAGEDVLEISSRGLPPSKEKLVRTSYKALRPALLKSANLKTETTVAKREIIVPDKDAVVHGGSVKKVEWGGYLVGHLTVKITPYE